MFTGIVTDIGKIRSIDTSRENRLEIRTSYDMSGVDIGASICCSGVCLTVVEKGADWFAVEISGETISKTTVGQWRAGSKINLERALKIGDELGGHIVSGHVDGVGILSNAEAVGGSICMTIQTPDRLARLIAAKGSIAIDGVSLTVNEVDEH